MKSNHNNSRVIGTKWIFYNKQDDQGGIVRNMARLVVKGFSQVKGLNFGRLEAIHIVLGYASNHNIKLFQMYVKFALLMAS